VLVVGGDDHPVVRDDLLEQLVEAVVDALVVEVAQRAGSVEQKLGDPCLPLQILVLDRWTVANGL
jgi:hypothetical protein